MYDGCGEPQSGIAEPPMEIGEVIAR